jgi:hypothetical protein
MVWLVRSLGLLTPGPRPGVLLSADLDTRRYGPRRAATVRRRPGCPPDSRPRKGRLCLALRAPLRGSAPGTGARRIRSYGSAARPDRARPSWLAPCNHACRLGYSALYRRASRLLEGLALARADGSLRRLHSRLAKARLLILNERGLQVLDPHQAQDLLDILEDRSGSGTTVVVTQVPVSPWHARLGDPTVADAICDRLVHGAPGVSGRSAARGAVDATRPTPGRAWHDGGPGRACADGPAGFAEPAAPAKGEETRARPGVISADDGGIRGRQHPPCRASDPRSTRLVNGLAPRCMPGMGARHRRNPRPWWNSGVPPAGRRCGRPRQPGSVRPFVLSGCGGLRRSGPAGPTQAPFQRLRWPRDAGFVRRASVNTDSAVPTRLNSGLGHGQGSGRLQQ